MYDKQESQTGKAEALPLYSIGAISSLSGVPTETIRIWERRYKLLSPTRSAGGHRQYSEADVEFLRALKQLTSRGMRIGTLAKRSREDLIEAAGPLEDPAPEPTKAKNEKTPSQEDGESPYAALIDEVIEVASRFDNAVAEALITRPLVHNDANEVVRQFYLPLLAKVGDRWEEGTLDVAVEHLIEKLVTTRIHAVQANRPVAAFGARAVCACIPGDLHEVGLLAASLALRELGLDVTYLGGNLPLSSLVRAIEQRNPVITAISVTLMPTRSVLDELSGAYHRGAFRNTSVIFGGAAATGVAAVFGGDAHVARDMAHLEEIARDILKKSN